MTPQKNALDALERLLAYAQGFGECEAQTIRAALQAAQVPAEYRIADQSMAEAYQELFGMLCELKKPPVHSEMNDIINLILKHWGNK